MSTKRILLLIFGGLLILVSVIAILAGGAMVWASQYHKDSEGFHVTDSMDVRSGSYAIISDTIETGELPPPWTGWAWTLSSWRLRTMTPRRPFS